MHFFGQMMEDEMKMEGVAKRKGPKNFLSSLDRTTFDMNYLSFKMSERSLKSSPKELLKQWKHRRLVSVDEVTGMITKLV